MKKNNVILYLCIAIFGVLGIYLTFIGGNIDKYDSKVEAYKIYQNESYDSDDGTIYYPIYYFKVNGKDYECKAKVGSSSYPNEKKNMVYYDSANPEKCKTEYEKSTNKVAGIVCLVVTVLMVYFFIIKKPSDNVNEFNQMAADDMEGQFQIDQEDVEKVVNVVEKVQLIYKRVIIGIIIVILSVFILIDTFIVKQTIVSSGYPEVIATYVDKKNDDESDIFDDCIYTFEDIHGRRQEIIVSISKETEPEEEIKIKYNENNPQDYYVEGSIMNRNEFIWYVVKVIVMVLLIILFFNKNLLNKINISTKK